MLYFKYFNFSFQGNNISEKDRIQTFIVSLLVMDPYRSIGSVQVPIPVLRSMKRSNKITLFLL